jgi:hypothetical protein
MQDQVVVMHTRDGKPITFYHPAVQSTFMFLGEFLCLVPYLFQQWHRHRHKRAADARHATLAPYADAPAQQAVRHQQAQLERAAHTWFTAGSIHAPLLEPSPRPLTCSGAGAQPRGSTKLREASRAVFVLALPTLCDAASTTLMNVGLYYTSASVFQMLRGTVVFFAGAPHICSCRRQQHALCI